MGIYGAGTSHDPNSAAGRINTAAFPFTATFLRHGRSPRLLMGPMRRISFFRTWGGN